MSRTSPRESQAPCAAWPPRPDRWGPLARRSWSRPSCSVGDEDVITPPAEAKSMAEALPNARLEVIPQAGHMSPYENPSEADAVILRFLKSLETRN